jgi:hypothetical protein
VKAGALRIIIGLALSALSAVMLFFMWSGRGNLWPLVFVAFVPMYVAQYRLLPRKLSAVALAIAAFGYWLATWSFGGLGDVVTLVSALIPARCSSSSGSSSGRLLSARTTSGSWCNCRCCGSEQKCSGKRIC